MKQKKLMIGLIIAIVVVFIVDGVMILYVNKNKKTPTIIEPTQNENPEIELGIKKRVYTCIGEDKTSTHATLNISYRYQLQYLFSLSEDDKIISGNIKQILTFNSEGDYNIYIQNELNETDAIREEDSENNIVSFNLYSILPNTKSDDQLLFTEDYLKVLEEQGFVCEE